MLIALALAALAPQFPSRRPRAGPRRLPRIHSSVFACRARRCASSALHLARAARPGVVFDAVGNRSFLCGTEDGGFESWVWPYQIFFDGKWAFRAATALDPRRSSAPRGEIVVEPWATTLRYKSADCFADVTFVCPDDEPGILLFLAIDADVAGTLAFSFMPRLRAAVARGARRVAAAYRAELGGFQLSEPSARVAAIVGLALGHQGDRGNPVLPPQWCTAAPRSRSNRCAAARNGSSWRSPCSEGDGAPDKARQQYLRLLRDARPIAESHAKAWEARASANPKYRSPVRRGGETPIFARRSAGTPSRSSRGLVRSDTLGDGLVAGYGPAGELRGGRAFAWYFTGDVSVNAPAYLAAGFTDTLKVGLRFAARHQRRDGKIPHEVVLSAPLCGWFDKYPFAYIHGETTGLWIHACRQALDWTGDRALLDDYVGSPRARPRRVDPRPGRRRRRPPRQREGEALRASEIGALRANPPTDISLGIGVGRGDARHRLPGVDSRRRGARRRGKATIRKGPPPDRERLLERGRSQLCPRAARRRIALARADRLAGGRRDVGARRRRAGRADDATDRRARAHDLLGCAFPLVAIPTI